MATVTIGTAAVNQAEAVHAGVNAAVCRVSISATTSAGDVLRIGKLPHRAVVLDAVFYAGAAFVNNGIWKFGRSASEAGLLASASYSTGGSIRTGVNVANLDLSRSDADNQRYTYITATPTAVITAGHACTLVVFYKMAGQSLA